LNLNKSGESGDALARDKYGGDWKSRYVVKCVQLCLHAFNVEEIKAIQLINAFKAI